MPKSVTMIVERFWPAIGGVEKHVFCVAQELISRGWNVRVITGAHEEKLTRIDNIKDIEIHRIPLKWSRSPLLATLWMMMNRRLWVESDIVHFHDIVPLLFWCLPILAARRTKSTAITFHGYERDPIPQVFLFLRQVARQLMGKKSLCIGKFIERCYDIECGRVTLGAVETPVTKTTNRHGLVFVGRIEKDTGIMEYIEAVHILKETHGIDMQMKVIGEGSLKSQAEQHARENSLQIEFWDAVHDPWSIAGNARICLAVGFLSILEAMSLGIPVVSFATSPLRIAYLRSVRDAGGHISIQTTPEGIAREIIRLMSDQDLYQRVSNMNKAFAGKLTWSALTDEYLRLWESAIQH